MKELLSEYKKKRVLIKKRLKEFGRLYSSPDEDIFAELSFCILTPQSRALACDRAISELRACGLLFKGGRRDIRSRLKNVRFPNKKASFLVDARRLFGNGGSFDIKGRLDLRDIARSREWLVDNVKGLGYKEASHFLRNIGLGRDLAILDVHILKNLKRFGVITKVPSSMTKKRYLEIEEKMRRFSKRIDIPLDELDLLLWSKETGVIFK
ncbi:MAG: N-glycosylase/DNA lyase [Candidatus Omnitrophica bacterium]|nr:N-glycosylase/DNA lyase [Candidatus Omnitrophota bacterium]